MKLSRLLLGLIALLWVIVFFATLFVVVNNTRDYLHRSMESHAQDTATSLGLSISQGRSYNDKVTIELMTSAIFDRGYYSEILVKKGNGEEIFKKRVEKSVEGVPGWFMESFKLPTPRMDAVVMDGWRKAARAPRRWAFCAASRSITSRSTAATRAASSIPAIGSSLCRRWWASRTGWAYK